jgi:transcriptional regulator with XRE-family HTH domain
MSGDELKLTTMGHRLLTTREDMVPPISREEAGRAVGVGKVTVKRWEIDSYSVPTDKLLELAKLYDVDAGWLLTGRGNARASPSVARYLASPMAGVVTKDIAERLRWTPYDLFGYVEPDESDVASVRGSIELHLARAFKKSHVASQPAQIEPPAPGPPAPQAPAAVPKQRRKSKQRSD